MCASNHFDVVACVRSGPGVEYPDLQLCISPIAMDDNTWEPLQEHAFQVHVGLMRAHSRGKIELRSSNPADPPRILVNYLKDKRDRELLRKGIHLVRELLDQPSFSELKGEEIFPGENCKSDSDLDKKLNSHISSQWHLSCTARMGLKTDKHAVVDNSGRVHGFTGLRVVDASIMPFVTNGNTNAPTIMIAEKISDKILEQSKLWAMQITEELKYVGTLCVEFFIDRNDNLYVNEIAPRVHNSGHLTINAYNVSQFENHVRAVCKLEQKSLKKISNAMMTNIIGDQITNYRNKEHGENEFFFDYLKKEIKEKRKMGHLTTLI